ncbi:MAG: hypothetical protein CVT63_03215 [Candidatus Anoxymicrobium japonicum]|uniref:MoaD/ThiS family protein n=1 Tax=Candidatus Anoxymicrobium japonicum TaxID=2013648 RepID=A0A2N3G6N6_9ACTN|nr:MAG: hypothetical protein CVT63_03215 [Candidatus Anoxymicrobium japonicum]
MEIEVKAATILLDKANPKLDSTTFSLEVADGATVRELLEMLCLPAGLVGSVTINKKRQPVDTVLSAGDRVAIIPAIFGG